MKKLVRILLCLALAASVCGLYASGQSQVVADSTEVVTEPTEERTAVPSQLSTNAAEVVRLAESGVEQEVILAYVEGYQAFELSAEDLIYLKDLGIEAPIIAAMLRHDTVLKKQN